MFAGSSSPSSSWLANESLASPHWQARIGKLTASQTSRRFASETSHTHTALQKLARACLRFRVERTLLVGADLLRNAASERAEPKQTDEAQQNSLDYNARRRRRRRRRSKSSRSPPLYSCAEFLLISSVVNSLRRKSWLGSLGAASGGDAQARALRLDLTAGDGRPLMTRARPRVFAACARRRTRRD